MTMDLKNGYMTGIMEKELRRRLLTQSVGAKSNERVILLPGLPFHLPGGHSEGESLLPGLWAGNAKTGDGGGNRPV